MKAVILNSGTGSRMGPYTESQPKCLVSIDGKTILGRQLESLKDVGVDEFVITTGPFASKIKEYVEENFPNLKLSYIHSPRYNETNYIYSMYLAREEITDDIILMHGDVVYDSSVIHRLMDEEKNGVLINKNNEQPKKDFKGRIEDGLVTEISTKIFDENCFELMPIYKLSEQAMNKWVAKIEEFVSEDNVNVYAENALNEIINELQIMPVFYTEFCMEIDTPEDLESAKRNLK